MNDYFQTSRPLSRSQFIELCREASQLTLLMYAPLGLPSIVENLWSESELQEFRDHYRQWEDALSTHIYNWKQIPADRVAASMHHNIEVKKDELVLGAIQLGHAHRGQHTSAACSGFAVCHLALQHIVSKATPTTSCYCPVVL